MGRDYLGKETGVRLANVDGKPGRVRPWPQSCRTDAFYSTASRPNTGAGFRTFKTAYPQINALFFGVNMAAKSQIHTAAKAHKLLPQICPLIGAHAGRCTV
jgi:hypothetical protein